MEFKIKEKSMLARLAAWKLKSKNVAITFGNKIHLYNISKEEFLKNEKWVKHELCHVRQFEKYGFFRFIAMYLWESIKVGYYKNKFEAEAREAENEPKLK
ncbi:MAG TPA: DUF4157 domain-containing protein [Hanamia sp.]|nr:DUF4157 domain-containing protein [Hanamia sp.]